jgi:chlorobactene glucosyltransferase
VNTTLAVGIAAFPWIALPLAILWRLRNTTSLERYAPTLPADAPLVSVIIPARDEARNIEACGRSILATTWPNIEVIVVDDHSTDATGDIARRLAAADPRVKVVDNPDLPDGWFGKQWACHNGAKAARGALLLFTDADTRHGPELLARSVNAMRERGADLFTVGGSQTMETFWERLLQPHVFGMLVARFGDTDSVSRSTNPHDKIANGQFMLMRRDVYDLAGGHEAVRTHVAEDLRLAQEWTRLGYSVQIVAGFDYMSTRMYEGFGEIMRGWGKNLWAAGRDTIDIGPAAETLLRIVAPIVPFWEIAPVIAIALAAFGVVPGSIGAWGMIAFTANTLYWTTMHIAFRAPVWYALLNPLAAIVLVGLFARSAWRGDRVEWKGREYISR